MLIELPVFIQRVLWKKKGTFSTCSAARSADADENPVVQNAGSACLLQDEGDASRPAPVFVGVLFPLWQACTFVQFLHHACHHGVLHSFHLVADDFECSVCVSTLPVAREVFHYIGCGPMFVLAYAFAIFLIWVFSAHSPMFWRFWLLCCVFHTSAVLMWMCAQKRGQTAGGPGRYTGTGHGHKTQVRGHLWRSSRTWAMRKFRSREKITNVVDIPVSVQRHIPVD